MVTNEGIRVKGYNYEGIRKQYSGMEERWVVLLSSRMDPDCRENKLWSITAVLYNHIFSRIRSKEEMTILYRIIAIIKGNITDNRSVAAENVQQTIGNGSFNGKNTRYSIKCDLKQRICSS